VGWLEGVRKEAVWARIINVIVILRMEEVWSLEGVTEPDVAVARWLRKASRMNTTPRLNFSSKSNIEEIRAILVIVVNYSSAANNPFK
jgi:hypothetical protein